VKTAAEILIDAKTVIEKHGWVQKKYGDWAVGFCAVGAIDAVSKIGDGVAKSRAFDLLREGLPSSFTGTTTGLVAWNDSIERTKDEVIAKFNSAIEKAQKETNENESDPKDSHEGP
jgi:hypothetical protein